MVLILILSLFLHSINAESSSCEPEPSTGFDPCPNTSDLKCIGKVSTAFIRQLAVGSKELGAEPMDPLCYDSVKTNVVEGMSVYYNNFVMTGFKNVDVEILKFRMGEISIEQMTFDFKAESDILIKSWYCPDTTFNGNYSSQGRAVVTVPIRYDVVTKDGVELFDIKPAEGTQCKILDDPEPCFGFNEELDNDLCTDENEEVKKYVARRYADETKVFKEELCIILKEAVASVLIPGIHCATKTVPVSAFFKDTTPACECEC